MNRLKLKSYNDETELFQSSDRSVKNGSTSFAFNSTIGYQRYSFTRSGKHGLSAWKSWAVPLNEVKLDAATASTIQKNGTLSFTEIPVHFQAAPVPVKMELVKLKKNRMPVKMQSAPNTKPLTHNGFISLDVAHFNC